MRRSYISLLIGSVLALIAVLLVSHFSGGQQPSDGKTTKIVIAAQDIPFGSPIIRDYLVYADWPTASIPPGAFRNMDQLIDDKTGKGNRVALHALHTGEPLVQSQISGFGDKSTLSRKVSEGKRAFSVRVNDVSGVSGFLAPGDRVDVMLTQGNSSSLVTDVILQNMMILGIDQTTDESSDKPVLARTVTLEVTADEAQKLATAQQAGTLSLTLRNYTNNAEISTGRVSLGDLQNTAPHPAANSNDNAGGAVRIRRGISVN
jgi:pilus assembly protein CpaB